MKFEIVFAIIISGITLLGSFTFLLFDPESFLIHPVFEIDVTKSEKYNQNNITVKNVG